MANEKKEEKDFDRMPRGAKIPGKKLDFKVLLRVISYLKPYKLRVALAVFCLIVNSIAGVVASLAFGWVIDDYITPMLSTGFDGPRLLSFLLVLAAIFMAAIVSSFASNRIFVRITQHVMKDVRDNMFAHMQMLPVKYYDTHSHGSMMSHYTNDTETLRQLLSQTLPQMVGAVITLVTTIVSMLTTSVWLLLLVLVCVAFMMMITGKIGSLSGRYFVRQQQSIATLNGYVEEMISGQRVVKVFNHEKAAVEGFDDLNEKLYKDTSTANAVAMTMFPVMGGIGNFQYAFLAVVGAAFAVIGVPNLTLSGISVLTLGNVVSFLMLARSFSQTVSNVSQQASSVVMAMAGAKRIFDLMDEGTEIDEGDVTLVNCRVQEDGTITECEEKTDRWAWKKVENGRPSYRLMAGDVRLNHVDFSYTEDKQILYDISLYAKPGQKVALVGSTGAGKTTITNLINRFYDIQKGEILYDGIPIRHIKKDALRHSLGIVLQDVNLFTGTIRENIRYGKIDASDEEVIAAAKLANAHDFIMRLPQGYDTEIDGTGSQLSQGQRQLISIARAAIADPPVMILDEATSSIDTRTEAIVQRGMDALMKGRTVFVIAHRLSTVQNSDAIMVLEHGRIIERGSHDDLIAQRGKYYQLYTGAFEME